MDAPILEIFESRQGEGLCVGDQQLFIRFGGCNLACDYCDTPESIPPYAGPRTSLDAVLHQAQESIHHFDVPVVSITGGEPLLQVGFLQLLLPRLKAMGWKIYLETNGALPAAFEKIGPLCDWVGMDLKLPTAIQHDVLEAHQWFLKKAVSDNLFAKIILTQTSAEPEFQHAVRLLEHTRPNTPLVLQPATPIGPIQSIPLPRLVSWWTWASRVLKDVRIIPQIHPIWGLR